MTEKKTNISQVQIVSYIMLTAGLFIVIASFLFNSSIAALIGLGLTFWGALLLYVKPEDSTRKNLVEASVSPSLITLNQLIQELGYKGDTTYLPPRYFTDPQTTKICLTKDKNGNLPTPEQTRLYENTPVGLAPQAIFLTPSGIQLSRMLEKALKKNFTKISLESLQQKLPKVFIEDLEIAENIELETAQNPDIRATGTITETTLHKQSPTTASDIAIHARITHPANGLTFKETPSTDCPICSAIAIAITKATDKPVRIKDTSRSEDGDIIEATYLVMEE
jgi:hypothetical protein